MKPDDIDPPTFTAAEAVLMGELREVSRHLEAAAVEYNKLKERHQRISGQLFRMWGGAQELG